MRIKIPRLTDCFNIWTHLNYYKTAQSIYYNKNQYNISFFNDNLIITCNFLNLDYIIELVNLKVYNNDTVITKSKEKINILNYLKKERFFNTLYVSLKYNEGYEELIIKQKNKIFNLCHLIFNKKYYSEAIKCCKSSVYTKYYNITTAEFCNNKIKSLYFVFGKYNFTLGTYDDPEESYLICGSKIFEKNNKFLEKMLKLIILAFNNKEIEG